MAVSKPLVTEFGIHDRLESCVGVYSSGSSASLVIEKVVNILQPFDFHC